MLCCSLKSVAVLPLHSQRIFQRCVCQHCVSSGRVLSWALGSRRSVCGWWRSVWGCSRWLPRLAGSSWACTTRRHTPSRCTRSWRRWRACRSRRPWGRTPRGWAWRSWRSCCACCVTRWWRRWRRCCQLSRTWRRCSRESQVRATPARRSTRSLLHESTCKYQPCLASHLLSCSRNMWRSSWWCHLFPSQLPEHSTCTWLISQTANSTVFSYELRVRNDSQRHFRVPLAPRVAIAWRHWRGAGGRKTAACAIQCTRVSLRAGFSAVIQFFLNEQVFVTLFASDL